VDPVGDVGVKNGAIDGDRSSNHGPAQGGTKVDRGGPSSAGWQRPYLDLDLEFDSANGAGHSNRRGDSAVAEPPHFDSPLAERQGTAATRPARPRARRTPKRPTVSLIIPAKNEARNLHKVLAAIPKGIDEIILVDGLSTDVTHLVATSCKPDIRIVSEMRSGKGHALRAGFAAATCDIVVAMDADGSMCPEEIPNYIYFLEHGFDLVKGSRFTGGGSSLDITPLRRLGNRVLLTILNHLYQTQLTDLCYGYFAFYRKFLDHLDLESGGFEIETELTVRAAQSGLRIAEIPSLELPRHHGRSNLRSFRDGLRVLHTLLQGRNASAPRRPDRPSPLGAQSPSRPSPP
jgi:hypothetical protein